MMNLYEITTSLIGPLPPEYAFIYGITTMFMAVGGIFCLLAPFLSILRK